MVYFFIGPSCAGKSTQAALLADTLQIPRFSLGDELKEMAEKKPSLQSIIEKGDLVPIEYISEIIHYIDQQCHTKGCIIDGFPRSSDQLITALTIWPAQTITGVVLDVTDSIVYERVSHRHLKDDSRRYDDKESTVQHRLELYHANEEPLMRTIKQHQIRLIHIPGGLSIEEVHQAILKAISS